MHAGVLTAVLRRYESSGDHCTTDIWVSCNSHLIGNHPILTCSLEVCPAVNEMAISAGSRVIGGYDLRRVCCLAVRRQDAPAALSTRPDECPHHLS
jgi:hypothetical protein